MKHFIFNGPSFHVLIYEAVSGKKYKYYTNKYNNIMTSRCIFSSCKSNFCTGRFLFWQVCKCASVTNLSLSFVIKVETLHATWSLKVASYIFLRHFPGSPEPNYPLQAPIFRFTKLIFIGVYIFRYI